MNLKGVINLHGLCIWMGYVQNDEQGLSWARCPEMNHKMFVLFFSCSFIFGVCTKTYYYRNTNADVCKSTMTVWLCTV